MWHHVHKNILEYPPICHIADLVMGAVVAATVAYLRTIEAKGAVPFAAVAYIWIATLAADAWRRSEEEREAKH